MLPTKKTNERPREQCDHFMYFFANSIKLMKLHLLSRTTFQALNLHTTKYMSLYRWCTFLRPLYASLNPPISFKTCILTSFTMGLYSLAMALRDVKPFHIHWHHLYRFLLLPLLDTQPEVPISSITTFKYPTTSFCILRCWTTNSQTLVWDCPSTSYLSRLSIGVEAKYIIYL